MNVPTSTNVPGWIVSRFSLGHLDIVINNDLPFDFSASLVVVPFSKSSKRKNSVIYQPWVNLRLDSSTSESIVVLSGPNRLLKLGEAFENRNSIVGSGHHATKVPLHFHGASSSTSTLVVSSK
jgi:hypothetical protein